jgi:hypothetical protein
MEQTNIWTAISSLAMQIVTGIGAYFPNLLGGLLVFVLGIVISNWIKQLVVKGLQALKFETLIKDTKIREYLVKAEITAKAEEILGSIVKWLVLITFFIAATNIWGLRTVSDLLAGILGYLPRIISAVIVFALGILLAGIVEGGVKAGLGSIDLHSARLMGKLASYLVVIITGLAAISELQIAQNFINILFIGFVATLTIGIGLAFGLGAKDTVSKFLDRWYNNLR